MKEFPEQKLQIKDTELFQDWVFESNKIDKELVYEELEKLSGEKEISKEFIEKSFKAIKKRLVLGGYRLATVLEKIYKKEKALCPVKYDKKTEEMKPEKKIKKNHLSSLLRNLI
jgi:hypothetical protein